MAQKPWRKTTLIHSSPLSAAAGCKVYMKLDNLQPSGSFKSRGVGNFVIQHLAKQPQSARDSMTSDGQPPIPAHFYCSSGGNAGLACVKAALQFAHPCTIVVPVTAKQFVVDKVRAAGASDVIVHGASWQEADTFMREELIANDPGGVYVHPFDHPDVWAGHATLVAEIADQLEEIEPGNPPPDAIICSVGGGGLFNGIVQGKLSPSLNEHPERLWSEVPVIAVETQGADSLAASLAAGRLETLPAITSAATSLGARRVSQQTFDFASDPSMRVSSLVVTDDDAARACVRFAEAERIMVELACGAGVAVLYDETRRLEQVLRSHNRWKGPETRVILEVCGGSIVTIDMLAAWKSQLF